MTSITIPSSVIAIDDIPPFNGCYNLVDIIVDENNPVYKSIDGVLYSKDGKTLIAYPEGKTTTSFTIPDNVTSISSSAFSWSQNLTNITIGDNVVNIGDGAFSFSKELRKVTIGNGVTYLDSTLFYDCSNLESVVLGTNVQTIIWNAFEKCESLREIYINRPENSIEDAPWGADNATIHWDSTGPDEI